jgi:cytochrome b involved in lipid metabolism
MKRYAIFVGAGLSAALILAPASAAAVKEGAACKKAGLTSVAGGMKYTCVKKGSKLIWGKGVAVKAGATAGVTYTMEKVKANASAASCWAVISGNVYDLTKWIGSHPGGEGAITSLCGTDGTSAFLGMHTGQSKPQSRLSGYLLGPLAK